MTLSTKKLNGGPVPRRLVSAVKKWLKLTEGTGTQAKSRQSLDAHWHIGKELMGSPAVTRSLLQALADEANSTYLTLHRCRKFYEAWPKGLSATAHKLSWSHHLALAAIDDKLVRDFYLKQTLAQGWTRESLQHAIKNNLHDKPESERALPKIKPQFLDPLFVYVAYLVGIIDGDTLDIRIDLGFEVLIQKRIRLRGLNTAEMGPKNNPNADALKAKAFVESKLKIGDRLIIKTFKTDIYGRFVADVYYHPTLFQKEDVLKNGFCLNQQLLDEGLARPMMV